MGAFLCGRRALPAMFAMVLALLAGWATAPTARAAESETLTIVVPANTTGSSCSGDVIATDGMIVITTRTTVSESGNLHVNITSDFTAATGIGTMSGRKFRSDTISSTSMTVAAGSTTTSRLIGHFIVSGESPGINALDPGDDFYEHALFHLTVSANGVPTAFVDTVRAECK